MKVSRKPTTRLLSLLLVISMLLGMMLVGVSAAEPSPRASSMVKDAILYTINGEDELEYNVVYSAKVTEDTYVSDETDNGIDSVEKLAAVMGTPGALGKAVTADLVIGSGAVMTVAVKAVTARPVIGISWKGDSIGSDYRGFAEAFDRNGGNGVFLPQVANEDEAAEVLDRLDGIFMTGGSDWNPSLYDPPEQQTPHGSGGPNDARDTSDISLMRQAIKKNVPMLAVCRGEQGFNIAMGGGLIQDVPYYLGQQVVAGEIAADRVTRVLSGPSEADLAAIMAVNDYYSLEDVPDILRTPVRDNGYTMLEFYEGGSTSLGNSLSEDNKAGSGCVEGHLRVEIDGLRHSGGTKYHELAGDAFGEGLSIDPNSRWLYDIIGSDSIEMIATAHHQSVDPENLGDNIKPVAYSSDGIIEAIEYTDENVDFALAVQWHPERDALGGTNGAALGVDLDLCNALLGALVKYAAAHNGEGGAPTEATLKFTYPRAIPQDEVTVELYKGFPTSSSTTLPNNRLTKIEANPDGTFTIDAPGVYSYHIDGVEDNTYYDILKIFNVSEADFNGGFIYVEVTGGKLGTNDDEFGDGYQPTAKPSQAPDSYKMDSRDAMLCIWPDEILTQHFTVEPQGYNTPAFDGKHAAHEVTSQGEMMEYLQSQDAACDYMYLYSAGETPNYGFDLPLAIFTDTAIPEDTSLEHAAKLVNGNGKTTVWYQAQIHPNEPASGEGALVVIDNLINDPEAKALLEDINIVVVPRINPDGSYLYSRATYDGFDMNRDHMSLKAAELAQLHTAYRLFMAEVVVDTHEFTFFGANSSGYMSNADDLQTTPATSLNNDAAVTELALDMCAYTFQQAEDAGLRVYHYGTTVNNPIGRAYFGLYNALSFLVETRGIGAGRTNFERRVFSQETAVMSYLTYAADHAQKIKSTVAAARADTIAKGQTYDEKDILALRQTSSGQTLTDYSGTRVQYYLDGRVYTETTKQLSLNDTIVRGRIRPTAYVIPADAANIEKIRYIMDNQGAEYFFVPAGFSAELQQYYFVSSSEAALRDSAKVDFPNGAYVFPMDQVAANIIAMTMEPDVNDSNGYDGTLYQYGVMTYDQATNNFPLYRYTGNNPRTTLLGLPEVPPVIDFQPGVTYTPTVTAAERDRIHKAVEDMSGYVGDMVAGNGTYDPLTLIGGLADGSSYDSISRGRGGEAIPTEYPFKVADNENNQYEHTRKVAKLAWVVQLAKDLGFPVVVQRQDDKYVYVEIGDPDAPEMVMALSHLDSSTGSVSAANLPRWVNADGEFDTTAYHKPYVKDGWLYGAGVQDDSGPTLATLFAAKALMDAGVNFDRRIRIVMGCYEDGGPGTPTVADTLKYMDIPYYTSNPGFYDNWAYKSLNREETPIAGYTSDSRFPVVVGNAAAKNTTVSINLLSDAGKPFRLTSAEAGVTLREGDPTLKDIVYGSASQIASRAVFKLDVTGVSATDREKFISNIVANATARGWLPVETNATPKVAAGVRGNSIVLEINTGVAMEYPSPQYSKNAVVWGMYLISKALDEQGVTADALQLKKAADGISDLFFRYTLEGEAYIGRFMDIPEDLLRNPDNGVANLTFALMGGLNDEKLFSFYNPETGSLSMSMQTRSMHTNKADYDTALAAVTQAWTDRGFEIAPFAAFSNPTLYLSHENPLTALQLASYKATIEHDPGEFSGAADLLDISYPVGTTGGTLAGNFQNKMTAFGAVIPGNERWWHAPNERISVESIIQMTKMMADGMLEMARYTDAAGAQYMWADIDGLNADRADLDLLDVTIGTYKDASAAVKAEYLDDATLLGATSFDIPMWKARGNSSATDVAYAAGHGAGGVYLSLDDPDFKANTYVLPMRLEFKVERANVSAADWTALADGSGNITFNILNNGSVIPLTLPAGKDAAKFFSTRTISGDPDTIYVSVNLAVTDAPFTGVEAILADSKTDLYSLNEEYEKAHGNPFPERGQIEERGFFLFGDGSKNARFTSPDAIYVTLGEENLPVSGRTLTFTYPSDIPAEDVTVDLYKGYPRDIWYGLDYAIDQGWLEKVEPNLDGTYTLTENGAYSYHIYGDGYYNIMKIFNVTEDHLSRTITVEGGPLGGNGFEPTVKPANAPDTYQMDPRDQMLVFWPDEILQNHFTVPDQNYQTPAFTNKRAAHELTSQDEMMFFLADRNKNCDYMHLYTAGRTPNYYYDIPLAIFTKTAIPSGASLEAAAELVNANGKTTVWYQAQIHPNEPAAGEGALAVIDDLINNPESKALLDEINIVVVPRINPDGSYLFSRATYDGFDMNRDHMSLKSAELAQLHTAYRLFMAEVVIDTHEYDLFWGADDDGYMANADDLQTTPATSLNNNAAITALALDMCANTFQKVEDAGLRVYHYGTTVNNPIGRAYFGLNDALSFLIETRGIGAGRTNLERRVFTQETAVLAYLGYAAEHAEVIKETVRQARAETIAKGRTYDENETLALFQTTTGKTTTDFEATRYQYHLNGKDVKTTTSALKLNDHIERGRTRPTAYVVPADVANIDKILYIMDNQGAEYYQLSDNSSAVLEQYYYVDSYTYNGRDKGIVADLREATSVTFPNGAYVFPMDQAAANVIAMTMEPDVNDSAGYDGTLYQYGVVDYDQTTKNFPIYRYIGDNPRNTLVGLSSGSSGGGGGSSRYTVAVDSSSHGTVKADKTSASSGSKVTLTVTPDKGYVLSSLTVEDSKGKEIKVTEASGKYTFTMPASKVTVSAEFRAEDSAIPFSDVKESAWYYDAVVYAYDNDLFSGTSATTFSPDAAMTRAMLVTVLYSMEGNPDVSGAVSFTDVASGAWYYDAVRWATQKGIVSGYSDSLFGSNDIVTREQMAAILYGYAKYKNYGVTGSGSLASFSDAGQVSGWADQAVQWAVGQQLLSGKGNGILDPKGGATRAEVAQILMRFAEEIAG